MIDNYKIINEIVNNIPLRLRESYFKNNQKSLYEEIIKYTSDISDLPFVQKIWHWCNQIPNYYLCKCGNPTKYKI